MATENIVINRPQVFGACDNCALMNQLVQKIEMEVAEVIDQNEDITGATVRITCRQTNAHKVSPNINISYTVENGLKEKFWEDRKIDCPGLE